MLAITVHDIKGNCPVHKVGDKIIIENTEIKLKETDALCTHAWIIPLHPDTVQELKEFPIPINKEQFVFTKKGKPYSESWARKIGNAAKKELRINKLKLYEGTRHSVASQACNRGVSLDLIGKLPGHNNPKTTKRYSHVDPSRLISVIYEDGEGSQKTPDKKFDKDKILKLFS